MATKRCYYEVLSLEKTASGREIASAYRKLAIKYHPDSNPGDDEAVGFFKEAAEAYEVLNDENKRTRYDQYGHAGLEGGGGFQSTDDIFEAFGDMFGGAFGDIFGGGGGGGRGRRARRGADVRADVSLTLEEAAKGVDRTIEFNRHSQCETCDGSGSKPGSQPQTCARCGGQGQVVQSAGILRMQTTCNQCGGTGRVIVDPCSDCRGQGTIKNQVDIDVHIPAGVDDGMRVRLQGEGEPSPGGGPPGDCYCFISVAKHKMFHRDGNNLILQMPISFSQAALGATIEIPTLDGPVDLEVKAGTQSGEVFRKRGMGMPDAQGGRGGGRAGDLLIQTYIETPKKLTKRQQELLRELSDLDHKHVSPERKSFFDKMKEYFAPVEES